MNVCISAVHKLNNNNFGVYNKDQLIAEHSAELGGAIGIWHALDAVAMVSDEHDRHSNNLANTHSELLIACGNYITFVLKDANEKETCSTKTTHLSDATDNTIISICAFVCT